MTTTVINGVNVSQLFETVEAIKGDSRIAAFTFRARNRWVDGGQNETTINDYHGACTEFRRDQPFVFTADEPPVLLGRDLGANPVEYVLHALAACVTTSLIYHAAARGIRIDEVESRLEGDLDLRGFLGMTEEVRNGYQGIRISMRIKADAPDAKLQELCDIAKGRSPVFDIVTNGVPVSVVAEPAAATMDMVSAE